MNPIYDADGNLIGYEDAGDVTSEDNSWFWNSIGIDPTTISYKETSPTNQEIEKSLGISSSPLDFIKAVFGGKSNLGAAGSVAGLLGVSALANKMFGSSGGGGYAGYQGGIPSYTASRTMKAIPTTMTVPTTGGGTQVVPRRPGSGGISYFSPMTYTLNPATAGASTVTGGAGNDTVSGGNDTVQGGASGGIMSLRNGDLGSYSDGGQLLRGPGDGVSDDIPATIADKQPARLADGEFVIPARIVSELGNGSTEAGARKLYAMMDRIKKARRSAKDIAADTKTDRYLPR
jgi:hypothetical protein